MSIYRFACSRLSGIALLTASGLTGCVHAHFPYSDTPLSTTKTTRKVSGESASFAWVSCESVNADAIKDAESKLKEDESIVSIQWFDRKSGTFTDKPTCLTETGWVWAFYTFWWPQATKVTVQAYVASKSSIAAEEASVAAAKVSEAALIEAKVKAVKDADLAKQRAIASLKDLAKPLVIASHDVNVGAGEYSQKIVNLTLTIKNNGIKRVAAYKVVLDVSTKLGSKIGTLTLRSEDSSIGPLETTSDTFSWEDNPFIRDEIFDRLAGISNENLIVKLLDQTVVKTDQALAH